MRLTKREKAVALAMLNLGNSLAPDTFQDNGITGREEQMICEIEYMLDVGKFEELFDEAIDDIERWENVMRLLDE